MTQNPPTVAGFVFVEMGGIGHAYFAAAKLRDPPQRRRASGFRFLGSLPENKNSPAQGRAFLF